MASTTGTDADWVIKLIDVYPESYPESPNLAGHELMVASEILRGRFRENLEHPKPIAAGEVVPYRIDLHTNDHAFLKGSPNYGAGAEFVVPSVRPEPPEVRGQYLCGSSRGFSNRDAESLPVEAMAIPRGTARGALMKASVMMKLVPPQVGLWRSWERASMAWKRSTVRTRSGPPKNHALPAAVSDIVPDCASASRQEASSACGVSFRIISYTFSSGRLSRYGRFAESAS